MTRLVPAIATAQKSPNSGDQHTENQSLASVTPELLSVHVVASGDVATRFVPPELTAQKIAS